MGTCLKLPIFFGRSRPRWAVSFPRELEERFPGLWKCRELHGHGQARSSSAGRAVKVLWFNVSCVEVFLDREQYTRILIYGCTKAPTTLVYFKCEFISLFVYSEIDSNCVYFSGVAFGGSKAAGNRWAETVVVGWNICASDITETLLFRGSGLLWSDCALCVCVIFFLSFLCFPQRPLLNWCEPFLKMMHLGYGMALSQPANTAQVYAFRA